MSKISNYINISSASDFVLENIINTKNLVNLKLKNIKLDDFDIITNLFNNLDVNNLQKINCSFNIEHCCVQIRRLKNNKIKLYIRNIINSDKLTNFLLNLPSCIDYLYIAHESSFFKSYQKKMLRYGLKNLPVSLTKIKIIYITKVITDDLLDKYNIFDYFFDIKIPFGCCLKLKLISKKISTTSRTYNVSPNMTNDYITFEPYNKHGNNCENNKIVIENPLFMSYKVPFDIERRLIDNW